VNESELVEGKGDGVGPMDEQLKPQLSRHENAKPAPRQMRLS